MVAQGRLDTLTQSSSSSSCSDSIMGICRRRDGLKCWRVSTRTWVEYEHGGGFLSRRSRPESQPTPESGRVHRHGSVESKVTDSSREESPTVLEVRRGAREGVTDLR